jgi:hypothetical protein
VKAFRGCGVIILLIFELGNIWRILKQLTELENIFSKQQLGMRDYIRIIMIMVLE